MDDKNWPEEKEDNILSLDLNLTKATSLYLALEQAIVVFRGRKAELVRSASRGTSLDSSDKGDKVNTRELQESLEILKLVIAENTELLEEVGNIIQELDITPSKTSPIIIKP